MYILCVCGLHQQDVDKAGSKFVYLEREALLNYNALIKAFHVGIDITKGVHNLFSKSVEMIFTSTVRIIYFLEEHTNARWHVSKKVLQKNLL